MTKTEAELSFYTEDDIAAIHTAVLNWFADQGRDLPWRHVSDPWQILVAEMMLQQTQVDRVIPKWHSFLDFFPDPVACAAAPQAAIVAQWSGLGFNRRARYLHQCAQKIVEQYAGIFPKDYKSLISLPGVGPYTARAIRVFAFREDDAVLDTNVGRILSRFVGEPLRPVEAQNLADRLLPVGKAWDWNQALLDVGALHCRPKSPACSTCPIQKYCQWASAADDTLADPAIGSAAVSTPQTQFEGSDRQGRGRLLKHLVNAEAAEQDLANIMEWNSDPKRAKRVATTLVADGLVQYCEGVYCLVK